MFRASICPSSGEITVSMRNLVFVTLYGWLSDMQGAKHIRQSSIYSDKYQVSHRYGIFSLGWAHSSPKHVEKSNKHIKKIVHQVGSVYNIIQRCTANKTQKTAFHGRYMDKCERLLVRSRVVFWSVPSLILNVLCDKRVKKFRETLLPKLLTLNYLEVLGRNT